MEDMRAVLVHQDTRVVIVVVCVAADMVALIYDEDLFALLAGKALGKDTTGEARPDDQVIKCGARPIVTCRWDRGDHRHYRGMWNWNCAINRQSQFQGVKLIESA